MKNKAKQRAFDQQTWILMRVCIHTGIRFSLKINYVFLRRNQPNIVRWFCLILHWWLPAKESQSVSYEYRRTLFDFALFRFEEILGCCTHLKSRRTCLGPCINGWLLESSYYIIETTIYGRASLTFLFIGS